MALMNCPECSKEISDKAENCPKCGIKINKTDFEKKYSFGMKVEIFIGIIVVISTIWALKWSGILYYIF
ncbi:hypothetical protein GME_19237 [Halomonas sp. TD01]|uniref:zinc ribbon domain-containing protein n=1 Tax=Halomonas bluephagenesis TaxID=2778948 RepID=UPI000214F311|nr:zinc ribbon domain-containing protein [Halomonas bluephagenesis]EGP17898.1 hypothetical protein GME_19237 [Halomonas sp. TD01]WRK13126.1 hypothetical protein [Halomonas bluephagenesis]